MSAKQAKQPKIDTGFDIAKRYSMLTIAAMDAVSAQNDDELRSLLQERDNALDLLDKQKTLTREAIWQLNQAVKLDDELHQLMRVTQAECSHELTTLYRGKAANKAYRKQSTHDDSGALLERAS